MKSKRFSAEQIVLVLENAEMDIPSPLLLQANRKQSDPPASVAIARLCRPMHPDIN